MRLGSALREGGCCQWLSFRWSAPTRQPRNCIHRTWQLIALSWHTQGRSTRKCPSLVWRHVIGHQRGPALQAQSRIISGRIPCQAICWTTWSPDKWLVGLPYHAGTPSLSPLLLLSSFWCSNRAVPYQEEELHEGDKWLGAELSKVGSYRRWNSLTGSH